MNKMYNIPHDNETPAIDQNEKRFKMLENKIKLLTETVNILRQELYNAKRTSRKHATDISNNTNTYVRSIKR